MESKWFYTESKGPGQGIPGELRIDKPIPEDCVAECSGSGDAGPAVTHWTDKLGFDPPRELAIPWLLEFGAWTQDELDALSDEEIAHKVLWLACGTISDRDGDNDWDGWLGMIS